MHNEITRNIYFFQVSYYQYIIININKDQTKGFIAYIGPLLKPINVAQREHIFFAEDPADEST